VKKGEECVQKCKQDRHSKQKIKVNKEYERGRRGSIQGGTKVIKKD
jgi:hypothetical protein